MLNRLHETIDAVCPIEGVSGAQGNIRIDFRASSTAQQQADAQTTLAGFDWSQVAHDAWILARRRAEAIALLTDIAASPKALRALLLIILDEFNAHSAKMNEMLAAVDAATSLADLKTRYGAIADYPPRTKANLITAMTNKINAGDADT